jgi:hypothetical protein
MSLGGSVAMRWFGIGVLAAVFALCIFGTGILLGDSRGEAVRTALTGTVLAAMALAVRAIWLRKSRVEEAAPRR